MSSPPQSAKNAFWHYALLIVIPALLLWGIFSFSPNFKYSGMEARKSNPLGGDFLQEYAGGWILTQSQLPESLYDLETFDRQQHDQRMTGFPWDKDQYFPPVYPPFWYAAVSPLTLFDYEIAAHIWATLMTVCLIVALVLIFRNTNAPVIS